MISTLKLLDSKALKNDCIIVVKNTQIHFKITKISKKIINSALSCQMAFPASQSLLSQS